MHLSSEDLSVWLLALSQQPDLASGAIYQHVLCNKHIQCEEDGNQFPWWWKRSCSLRIDVLIHQPQRIIVVEVKPRCGLSAIGQAAGYAYIYTAQEKPTVPVKPWVVCHAAQPDVLDFAEHAGVQVLEVGWPEGESALGFSLLL